MENIKETVVRGIRRRHGRLGAYSAVGGLVALGIVVAPGTVSELSVGLLSTLAPVRRAIDRVEDERERTEAEKRAFDEFIERIQSIDAAPTGPAATGGPAGTVVVASRAGDTRLDEVTRAYRETFMALPHFEAEYDETIRESMAQELGEEVAASLFAADRFIPQLKEGLIYGADRARESRTPLLETVRDECVELREAHDALHRIEQKVGEIDDERYVAGFASCESKYNRLASLADRCERLLHDRQKRLQREETAVPESTTVHELYGYLYDPLEARYPVLEAGTTMVDRIRQSQRDVVERLCSLR